MHDRSSPALIFDFDGTLVDSLQVSLDILYRLIHDKPLPVEDISELRGMTMMQVLHRLRVSPWRALFIRPKAYKAMSERLGELELVPGVAELLQTLAGRYRLYILSSNDRANISAALERFGIGKYITAVQGGANPLSKAHALLRLQHKYRLAHPWYIGDQANDIRSAHRVDMKAAAVSWGFSNLHALESTHPDLLVFTPMELEQFFMQGNGYDND